MIREIEFKRSWGNDVCKIELRALTRAPFLFHNFCFPYIESTTTIMASGAGALDMALDDIISQNKSNRRQSNRSGPRSGGGATRSSRGFRAGNNNFSVCWLSLPSPVHTHTSFQRTPIHCTSRAQIRRIALQSEGLRLHSVLLP